MQQVADFDPTSRGFSIVAQGKSGKIYLYDVIGGDPFAGGISARMFADELDKLVGVESITIYVNSPGGSIFEGWTMVELLKRHGASIHIKIDGCAGSMASVIAVHGTTVSMAENAWMMIHDPFDASGRDGEGDKELLDKIKSQIVDAYVRKTGIPKRQIEAMMRAETWMTAHEAVKLRFADSIYEPVRMAACFDLSAFKHAPEQLMAMADCEPTDEPVQELPIGDQIANMRLELDKMRAR